MTAPSPWLTREQLADRWVMAVQTLADWAVKKQGPGYRRFGGLVRYSLEDVIAWENAQPVEGGVVS